jgi:hypothetical protein
MKNKGLLVAVALLAALGGALYWSEQKKAADEKKPPVTADAAPKILTIPEDQITSVRIEKRGAEATVLSKTAGTWAMTEPKPLAADQDTANAVAQNLSNLSSDRLIDEKGSQLAAYGLATPAEQITVTRKGGKTDTLLLGDDLPTGAGVYAKLAGDARVFALPGYSKTGIDKSAKELRDKRLLHFNSDKLTSVAVAAKGAAFEFGKNGQGEWQVVKPSAMRADQQQVDDLVRKLKEAKMDVNLSDEDAAAAVKAFAGAAKLATVTTADSGGTEQLEIRKGKEKDYYAKSSAVDGVYKTTAEVGDGLDKTVDAFRNKKLFDFGFAEPSQVGVGSQVFQKSGEKWMSGGGQMDPATVQALIDKLRDLTATGFAAKPAGEAFLALSAALGDAKKQERVSVTKQGAEYFATREGEPAVYQLDAKAVEDLQKAAAAVKPLSAAKASPKK